MQCLHPHYNGHGYETCNKPTKGLADDIPLCERHYAQYTTPDGKSKYEKALGKMRRSSPQLKRPTRIRPSSRERSYSSKSRASSSEEIHKEEVANQAADRYIIGQGVEFLSLAYENFVSKNIADISGFTAMAKNTPGFNDSVEKILEEMFPSGMFASNDPYKKLLGIVIALSGMAYITNQQKIPTVPQVPNETVVSTPEPTESQGSTSEVPVTITTNAN